MIESPMNFLKHTLANPSFSEPQSYRLANGAHLSLLDTGVLRVRPNDKHAGKGRQRVLISCGVHGNETAPIEIVDQLFREISAGELLVRNELLFIVGNPPAINGEQRFIEENLNRLFSAKHEQSETVEAKRAAILEKAVTEFFAEGDEPRLHYDLHTAIRGSELEKFVVCPYLSGRACSKSQLGFLERCGIQAVLLSNQPSGTFSYFTSDQFGASSFTVELGKVRKFGHNDMRDFEKMAIGLRRVIADEEDFAELPEDIKVFSVVEEVIKRSDAFQLHIEPDAKNFTQFSAGVLLASDKGYEYRTRQDGERFVFPISNVPVGQRALLVVAPTTL